MKARTPIKRYTPLKRTPLKRSTKPIRKISQKHARNLKTYHAEQKKYLAANPTCKAEVTHIIQRKSTEVHHKKGRGEYLLDIETWLATCRKCHDWIELHPVEAKELGLSEDRLTTTKSNKD